MIQAAGVREDIDTSLVRVDAAGNALDSLLDEAIEHRAAVVAESRVPIRVSFEIVRLEKRML